MVEAARARAAVGRGVATQGGVEPDGMLGGDGRSGGDESSGGEDCGGCCVRVVSASSERTGGGTGMGHAAGGGAEHGAAAFSFSGHWRTAGDHWRPLATWRLATTG